jgi:ribose-phosphate pyrophosphokinase
MTGPDTISADAVDRWVPDVVYSFPDAWNQAYTFARTCRAHLGECEVHRFPDGETRVTVSPAASLKGRVVAIFRPLHEPNAKFVELMLAVNAVRSLGADTLILVAPYLPYMRQDAVFKPGEAVSRDAIGAFLSHLFDGVVTIQPHLHRSHSFSHALQGKPVREIAAGRAIAAHMRSIGGSFGLVVGPDEESEPLVRDVGDMFGASWLVARKNRRGDTDVEVILPNDLAIKGQPITIIDDVVSSGGTMIALAKALKRAGAGNISAYIVHALFDQRAAILMERAGISKIRSLSTVPHVTNAIPAVDLICEQLGVKP